MTPPVIRQAAQWYAQLCSGQTSDADRDRWALWLQAHPDHMRAWQRIELLSGRLRALPTHLSAQTMQIAQARTMAGRRNVLKGFAVVAMGGGIAWAVRDGEHGMAWTADHRTAVGERREIALDDGSTLVLGTASAVKVAFDGRRRLVSLRVGEILVQTAADPMGQRPFIVETTQGQVRALGTRFTMREEADHTRVAVLEHAVEISPRLVGERRILNAGEQLRFSAARIDASRPADDTVATWTRGLLVVSDWPLADFAAELSRYRKHPLRCDPEVANLRLSGAFPLDDPERALTAMTRALPVRITPVRRWGIFPETRIGPR